MGHGSDAQGRPWERLLVYFAGTPWDGNMGTDQHIAGRLSRMTPVLYVDPPISLLSPYRNPGVAKALDGPRLRVVRPGLARLTPVVAPGLGRPGLRALARRRTRRLTRRAIRHLGGSVDTTVAATVNSGFGGVGERQRVFFATDDFSTGGELMGQPARWLSRQQDRLVAEADRLVVISQALADRFSGVRPDVLLVPNGVADEVFRAVDDAPWPSDVTLPRPIAGFVGHLSERIDLEYLEEVARRGHSLLLVGPRQPTFQMARLDSLLGLPNVQWVGSKDFDQLPSYGRAMRVGLLPYGNTSFNRASFPLKLLEYLAAGRAAVATALPAVDWLGTDLVDVATTPEEFADLVETRLQEPWDEETASARRAFAATHSWDIRASEFAEAIGLQLAETP